MITSSQHKQLAVDNMTTAEPTSRRSLHTPCSKLSTPRCCGNSELELAFDVRQLRSTVCLALFQRGNLSRTLPSTPDDSCPVILERLLVCLNVRIRNENFKTLIFISRNTAVQGEFLHGLRRSD